MKTKTIALHSYKGGTGKTTLITNLAVLYAREGLNVCLIDFDLYAPSLSIYFRKTPEMYINDLLSGDSDLSDVLVDLSPELDLKGKFWVGFSNPRKEAIQEIDVRHGLKWQLRALKSKGLIFFGLFLGDRQVGFVAIEKADDSLYYMEKLAVLPGYRHKAGGTGLVRFVLDYVKDRGGKTLSIGIIDEHTILKNWYQEFGFKEITTRKFPHLPFTVCFMEKDLS